MKEFTLLMNGEDVDTGDYRYYPYTNEVILDYKKVRRVLAGLERKEFSPEIDKYIYAKYCISKEEDYPKAIKYAAKAFEKYRRFSLKARRKIFHDMYELLLRKKEDFINLLIIEGHSRKLAEWEFEGMRVGSSPETVDFYFSQIRKEVSRYGSEIVYWARRPDGVVCMSSPGNASASSSYNAILVFLAGNTLVLKPPFRAPLSTIFLWKEVVWEALRQNGVPDGACNILVGNSQKITDTWFRSSLVKDIIYFGTSKHGLEIGRKAYQAGKKPILELSGNDLFLVWKDADIAAAADSLSDCFLGSTQICMVPKVALIHQDSYDKFVTIFKEKVRSLKFGLPTDAETVFSPVSKIKDFFSFLTDVLTKGGRLIYGGRRVNHQGEEAGEGFYLQPTLVEINGIEKARSMRCIQEEIFFPLVPLIKVFGDDEKIFEKMRFMVKSHQYGLRASLWASSSKYLRKFVKGLDNAGLLRINTRHIGFSYRLSTHGGTARSGGPFGEMNYFWHKTSHLQGVARRREVKI